MVTSARASLSADVITDVAERKTVRPLWAHQLTEPTVTGGFAAFVNGTHKCDEL
jgi:hypothetical protein